MQIQKGFLFILCLIISTLADASQSKPSPLYFSAETGWSSMASGHVSPYRFIYKKTFGYRTALGYLFPINNKWRLGPEVGYGYYGQINYENPTGLVVYYMSTGWSALGNLSYSLTDSVNLYLKGGATEVFQQYDISGANVTRGGFYQRKFCPTVVVATSYNLTDSTALSISYTHIFAKSAPLSSKSDFTFTNVNEVVSVNAIMAGVIFNI